ncbi:hypothetical protein H4Q26_006636 [Puccinia striiformis f. sp. tritici PST-130]|nr:hypothetical protein Pst134EB_020541 [Puccinia striiformis f. sp. tritici]KAI9610494.1 hypothetical protein H4Q26_006636 [Puccinia striiformis f. sp. tritici PST-130]
MIVAAPPDGILATVNQRSSKDWRAGPSGDPPSSGCPRTEAGDLRLEQGCLDRAAIRHSIASALMAGLAATQPDRWVPGKGSCSMCHFPAWRSLRSASFPLYPSSSVFSSMSNFNLPILQANTTGPAPGSDWISVLTATVASAISNQTPIVTEQHLNSLGVYLSNRLAGADPTVMLLATCGTIIILFAVHRLFPWRNTQDQAHTTEHQNTQYELLIELVRAVLDKLASIEQLIAEQQPKPNSTPAGPEH